MHLSELIAIADSGYPDHLIVQHFDPVKGCAVSKKLGDTLALFIARELCDTFDPDTGTEKQLDEAIRVMNSAINELTAVRDTLYRQKEKLS